MSHYASMVRGRMQVLQKHHHNRKKGRTHLVTYYKDGKLVKFEWLYRNNFDTDRRFDT